jgi:hypothetical protein
MRVEPLRGSIGMTIVGPNGCGRKRTHPSSSPTHRRRCAAPASRFGGSTGPAPWRRECDEELPRVRVGLLVGRARSKPLIGTAPAAILGELVGTLS